MSTKRKICRTRGNQKAAKERDAFQRMKRQDAFDLDLRRHNKIRASFHNSLQDACLNPQDYTGNEYHNTQIGKLAQNISLRTRMSKPEREALAALIGASRRTKLLDSSVNNFIEGLINLAKWSGIWINKPEDWEPNTKNAQRQFSSLARFLLCKYEVPSFMDKVWYKQNGQESVYQEWFINLGQGENIRKQRQLPIEMTKKMAHYFLQAPSSLEIHEAIRWGQVRALGGNDGVARAILATPLGRGFSNDEFWVSVIRFFIENPMLDHYQYGPIYDYILDQKYRDRGTMYVNNEIVHLGVIQPNFSMHRRNPEALLRQVDTWHRQMNRERTRNISWRQDCSWSSCGIPGMVKSGNKEDIAISEITTSKQLYAEGEKMRHCVGSYVDSCKTYRVAIYSLHRIVGDLMYREATISVNLHDRMITEARKSCNRPLTNSDWNYIQDWATKNKLRLSTWIR